MDAELISKWAVIKQQMIQARSIRGLFRAEVADLLGYSRSTIQQDEANLRKVIPLHRLEAYAKLYSWSVDKILESLGETSEEMVHKAARGDYVAFLHATEDLVHDERERATIQAAAANIVASRYQLKKDEFTTSRVHRDRRRRP